MIKGFKPITPTCGGMTVSILEETTTNKPEKFLIVSLNKHSGRSTHGRITSRHRGDGTRKKYYIIGFKRSKDGIPRRTATTEYDLNRTACIAPINYADGEKRYALQPAGLEVGGEIESGEETDIKVGNTLKLKDIPIGTVVHSIELIPGKGGQLAHSAGTST